MNRNWKGNAVMAAVVALAVSVVFLANRSQPALGQQEGKAFYGPRYTIVETQITNLIVTDNQENIAYYYTVDRDEKPGADLKLRGSLDLKQVGKPVLHPKKAEP
jgi:hypothetical protein